MEKELQELSDLVCVRFPPSHKCLYGLIQLKYRSVIIHRKKRHDWTEQEKEKIKNLLYKIIKHEGKSNYNYYKHITYNRIIEEF